MSTLPLLPGSPSYPALPEHTATGPHAAPENAVQKWLRGMALSVRDLFATSLDKAPSIAPKTSGLRQRLTIQKPVLRGSYGVEWEEVK